MTHVATQLNTWLAEIHPALRLDEAGACVIAAGNNRDLELFADTNTARFFLSTKLMDLPAQGQSGFFIKVLAMNLFMQDTRGATVAVDEQAGEVVLCFSQTMEEGDAVSFRNVLQNFTETARTLQQQMSTLVTATNEAAGPAGTFTQYQHAAPPAAPIFEDINPMSRIGHLV